MSGRSKPHYGFRVPDSMIPMVEITETRAFTSLFLAPEEATRVVKIKFGLTQGHAINRALKWMRKNGDPR